jgi:protein-tyrosine phosphatase
MKILMVCLGNICRSPLADGLLRKKVKDQNLTIEVDSAGTSGIHSGEAPDIRMQKIAKDFNTPIDNLKSRKFVVEDFDQFDLILAMDKSNYQNIRQMARSQEDKEKVHLILEFSENKTINEVPDPYYGGEEGFVNVYKLLDEATDKVLSKINN